MRTLHVAGPAGPIKVQRPDNWEKIVLAHTSIAFRSGHGIRVYARGAIVQLRACITIAVAVLTGYGPAAIGVPEAWVAGAACP